MIIVDLDLQAIVRRQTVPPRVGRDLWNQKSWDKTPVVTTWCVCAVEEVVCVGLTEGEQLVLDVLWRLTLRKGNLIVRQWCHG